MQAEVYQNYFDTPLGIMEVSASDEAVKSVYFVDKAAVNKENRLTKLAKEQMCEYFSGERRYFDLPLSAAGTDFQKLVWNALSTIDYGATCAYSDVAHQIENPKAVRAIGAANGRNPLTIIVPCHRVIGRDGSLTGYAGGTKRKAWLLKHERRFECEITLSGAV